MKWVWKFEKIFLKCNSFQNWQKFFIVISKMSKTSGPSSKRYYGSGGIRTHASEETGALNQRLRPLGHATLWHSWCCCGKLRSRLDWPPDLTQQSQANWVVWQEQKVCPRWGSNSRPSDYETDALPTALRRLGEKELKITDFFIFVSILKQRIGYGNEIAKIP